LRLRSTLPSLLRNNLARETVVAERLKKSTGR
jgi:hypothetical protein